MLATLKGVIIIQTPAPVGSFRRFYDNHSCFIGTSDIIFHLWLMGIKPSSQEGWSNLSLYDFVAAMVILSR